MDADAFGLSYRGPTSAWRVSLRGNRLNTLTKPPQSEVSLLTATNMPVPVSALAPFYITSYRPDLSVIARIRTLATYPEGWKGAGSKAPTRRAAEDAESFARIFFGASNVVSPLINLGADGEINFYWKTPDVVIDLGFYGTGTYSYYAMRARGEAFAADDVMIDQPLPRILLDLLGQSS